jgi:hypothetical protein
MQIRITPRHFRLSANLRQAGAAQILTLKDAEIGAFGAYVALIREDVARNGPRIECRKKKAGTSVGPNGSEQKAL